MISVYISCSRAEVGKWIEDLLRSMLIRLSGEQIAVKMISKDYCHCDRQISVPDIVFCEMGSGNHLKNILSIRNRYPEAELILLDPGGIASETYIDPDIRPSGVIHCRETDSSGAEILLKKVIKRIYVRRERTDPAARLEVHTAEETFYIPYSQIIYIEAKNKLITIHYDQGALIFRDSLKHLERILPEYFVRCYRSIIVNSLFVRKVNYHHCQITLSDLSVIPISRSCRKKLTQAVFVDHDLLE